MIGRCGLLLVRVIEMRLHLAFEHAFGQSLLQLADQAVVAQQVSAVLATVQQLVDQLIGKR